MFEVGDKVRVKEDLVIDKCYNSYLFTAGMHSYIGEEAIVRKVLDDSDGTIFYKLEIDGGEWDWTSDMLENVPFLSQSDLLKKSDLAIVVMDGKTHIIMNGVEMNRIKYIKFEQNGGKNAEITVTADIKKEE